MRSINWTSRAIVAGLMLAMTFGLGLAAPRAAAGAAPVAARGQDRDNQRWDRRRLSKYAFALGYNRGYEDASERSYRSYRDVQRWREGTEGWEDPMGNRGVCHDNFRRDSRRASWMGDTVAQDAIIKATWIESDPKPIIDNAGLRRRPCGYYGRTFVRGPYIAPSSFLHGAMVRS